MMKPAIALLYSHIYTYMGDGNPLPSFEGEPKKVELGNDSIDEFASKVWNALNEDNKVYYYLNADNQIEDEYADRITINYYDEEGTLLSWSVKYIYWDPIQETYYSSDIGI